MRFHLDANDLSILRHLASKEGIRPHDDAELRIEQLLSIKDVIERMMAGVEDELSSAVQRTWNVRTEEH